MDTAGVRKKGSVLTRIVCLLENHIKVVKQSRDQLSNNLIINQFYLFLYIQHSCIHTSSLPTLPTIVVETWEPFH